MPRHHITRRQAIQAVATLPLLAARPVAAAQEAKPASGLTIGIATFGFRDYTNRQLAEELAREGIRVVQLFLSQSDSRYWKFNGRADMSDMTPQRSAAIAETYRSAGISIHSIGVYTNLIHPDEAERKANLAYFEAMMGIGEAMGVRTFITEVGSYHPDKPEPRLPYHFQEDVWKMMVATGKELAAMAERHQATVLFESSFNNFLTGAKRTRVFLQEVGSPRIRVLLDPANILEINDLGEMFAQLAPWIDCLHAKDRKLHSDRGVPAGQGDVDYVQFVTLVAKHTPKAPLILEYVGPKDYKQALAHLRGAIRKAGLTER
ncbi:MAG: sugar phosphate isomerase/epimerase family protein [Verrucomicrobiia bacterium]